MGSSISKRVSSQLQKSPNFNTTCTTTFSNLETLTQHTFPGKIFAYQLPDAAATLHATLTHSLSSPLITNWCPSPPSRTQIDAAYRSIRRNSKYEETLDSDEFKRFAVVLFTNAVVANAEKAVVKRVCVGVAGIAGVGMVAKVGGAVVGSVVGVYAVGIAASVFVSLR